MHTPTGQRQTLNSRLGRSSSAGVNLWARSEARRQRRAGADQPVTFGESHTTELNGDALQSISALKMEEDEMVYLSKVLKDVDTCDSAVAVSEYLEGLDDMVTLRARKIERLVPSLRAKFRGEGAKSVYQSATSGQRYLVARSKQDWESSYKEFLVGCKGLSQESTDDVLQMILGNQFFHGVIDGVMTPDENFEMAVLRWGRELKQAELVLGPLYELIRPLSNELFKAKVRSDYRMWFVENRKSIWMSQGATLMDLAIEARAYEGTDLHKERGAKLANEFKKGGMTAVVGNVNSRGKHTIRCWFCGDAGHGKIECKTWKQLQQLLAGAGKGGSEVQDDLADLRHDVAFIATATDTCKHGLSEKVRHECA
jgi:hypothetical protein